MRVNFTERKGGFLEPRSGRPFRRIDAKGESCVLSFQVRRRITRPRRQVRRDFNVRAAARSPLQFSAAAIFFHAISRLPFVHLFFFPPSVFGIFYCNDGFKSSFNGQMLQRSRACNHYSKFSEKFTVCAANGGLVYYRGIGPEPSEQTEFPLEMRCSPLEECARQFACIAR